MDIEGRVIANSDDGGGSISISSTGDINVVEVGTIGIEANGTAKDAPGGSIELDADGDVLLDCPIEAKGATNGETLGGEITVEAGGDITTVLDGHIRATGKAEGGGSVILTAANDISIDTDIDVDGIGATGNGGFISLTGTGVELKSGADLSLRGGVNQGGGEAAGGGVEIQAGCTGITLDGIITATGGELGSGFGGGALVAETPGPILVKATFEVDSSALANGGDGGAIVMRSSDVVTITGGAELIAKGDSTGGTGATIELQACKVEVQDLAVLDVSGNYGGSVVIEGTDEPPVSTGNAPILIHDTADLKAAGTTNADSGDISLRARVPRKGVCSNDWNVECVVDPDCTVGCETGDCIAANPDIEGEVTQFDIVHANTPDPGTSIPYDLNAVAVGARVLEPEE